MTRDPARYRTYFPKADVDRSELSFRRSATVFHVESKLDHSGQHLFVGNLANVLTKPT